MYPFTEWGAGQSPATADPAPYWMEPALRGVPAGSHVRIEGNVVTGYRAIVLELEME